MYKFYPTRFEWREASNIFFAFIAVMVISLASCSSGGGGGDDGGGSVKSSSSDSQNAVSSSSSDESSNPSQVASSSSLDESSSSVEFASSSSFEQSSSSMEVASSSSFGESSSSVAGISSSSIGQSSSSIAVISSSSIGQSSSSVAGISSSSIGQSSSSVAVISSSSIGQSSSATLKECDAIFNPDNKFCYDGNVYDKCGGKIYNPLTQGCLAGKIEEKCGSNLYSQATQFCYDGAVYDRCDGMEYIPISQICTNGVAIPARCGGVGYNPLTQDCCGNSTIFPKSTTQRCTSGIVETKCGTNGWYNASDANLRCQSNVVETKCGANGWYNATNTNLRCQGNVIETKCGTNGWYNASDANLRCQSNVVETKCGTNGWYDATNTNLRCQGNVIETKCGIGWYNSATQFCYNSNKIGNFCGTRTEIFDPDFYECKTGNKIYLKTPVSYEGEEYEAVLIGTQTWMARNLNYNVTGSRCYGEGFDVYIGGAAYITLSNAEIQANCDTYGRLYDWTTAVNLASSCETSPCASQITEKHQGVCPVGWHIPSDAEWERLKYFSKSGTKLKANSSLWSTNTGTDDFGFSALPGGYGSVGFFYAGDHGYWWSSLEYMRTNTRTYYEAFFQEINIGEFIYGSVEYKSKLFSVRCLQD